MATTMKEKTYEDMFGIYALAYALLECRSEGEALRVLRYFTYPEQRKPRTPEYLRRSDGATPISK